MNALLAFAVVLPALAVDFDQAAVDARPPSAQTEPRKLSSTGLEDAEPAAPPAAVDTKGFRRTTPDCVRWIFEPGDKESEQVLLRSPEYEERCIFDPRVGHDRCWEQFVWEHREVVWITIPDRKAPLPWEKESFRVCLNGPYLYFDVLAGAYKYEAKGRRAGSESINIVLTAGAKTPMAADPNGVSLVALEASLRLKLTDKWASQYAGDKTVVSLELIREGGVFDSTILKKDVSLEPAESHSIDLLAFRSEFRSELKPGDAYYVKWGFKRVGKVSTDRSFSKGKTPEVRFAPAAGGSAR